MKEIHTDARGDASMRPNFIFIVADDLGYADLGCYGGREDCSPNLDKMATEGLLFTNGYANSSVCSPSRFAIITGRYQHRLRGGFDEPIATSRAELGLPPEHPTMPSLLRDAGYATALIGKWHMGYLPWFGPLKSRNFSATEAERWIFSSTSGSRGGTISGMVRKKFSWRDTLPIFSPIELSLSSGGNRQKSRSFYRFISTLRTGRGKHAMTRRNPIGFTTSPISTAGPYRST